MTVHTLKKYLFFALLGLPMMAFGNILDALHYFNPPQGDYSVTMLERMFGVVGNVVQGRGNQLFGMLVGVFNTCWIVAIGVGVMFVVWDLVMRAASHGDSMGASHGKKSAFKIIGIVVGFALQYPWESCMAKLPNG